MVLAAQPPLAMRLPRGFRTATPTVFVVANAIAFWLARPGVPDLWAARARASAVGHGVGLTYWFSWFGGSTPGNYSVVSPWLSARIGTETVAALAAVAAIVFATSLLRGLARAELASWFAVFGVSINLWCGRVPFLLGAAFALAALVCVRRRSPTGAALLAVAATLASPVAGGFLCLGLSGVLVAKRMRGHRAPALFAAGGAACTLATIGLVFGMPGPEPFPLYLIGEILLALILLLVAGPPAHIRTTLLICAGAAVVLFVVPNGMGANLLRLALFCLPPAVIALTRHRVRVVAALVAPILVIGALSSESAFLSATKPASTASFYTPLARELDALSTAPNYRLEVVGAGHAAYAALLDHAMLARGWETQEDLARNAQLERPTLDADAYRAWLDDNAVGLVAFVTGGGGPEARLLVENTPSYLRQIWQSGRWVLFQVTNAQPIVDAPAVITDSTQSALVLRVPCACRITMRVRWSRFLSASARLPHGTADTVQDEFRPVLAGTPAGWTTLTTNRPGTYTVAGTF